MLNSVLLGLLLAMITIAIHGLGTTWWIWNLNNPRTGKRLQNTYPLIAQMRVLCSTAAVLLILHLIEVIVWGIAYLFLNGSEAMSSFEEAIYFSTVTFASLGYGDVVIDGPWRLLSAIQAMTGLLAFGWSSALMFAIVQRIWEKGNNNTPTTHQETTG